MWNYTGTLHIIPYSFENEAFIWLFDNIFPKHEINYLSLTIFYLDIQVRKKFSLA